MSKAGCTQIGLTGPTLIARLIGANMNATTDQTIPLLIGATQKYVALQLLVKNCSTSLTTAAGSIYDTASKGGNKIFGSGATQAFSACTGTGTVVNLGPATGAAAIVEAVAPILSLTTGQGAAATADVYVYGYPIGQ